jgi:hypothetical protein
MQYKHKILLSVLLSILCSFTTFSQETNVYIGLGGLYHSFQDQRFSNIQFNKVSTNIELGINRISGKNRWHAGGQFYCFNEYFPKFDTAKIYNIGYNIRLAYLREIKNNFYLGATWDVVDYLSRDNSMLENNKNFYKTSSDVFLSAKYVHKLSERWQLNADIHYCLLSFINSSPSFTTNFPQNVVNDGEVSYSNQEVRESYSIKYMEAKPFWEEVYINTSVELRYKKNIGIGYSWNMRSWADTKDYPVIIAMHNLMVRYYFINHCSIKK